MLSTLRIATRQAAARRVPTSLFTSQAVRAGSTWANVPQGPPVSPFLLVTPVLPQLITSTSLWLYGLTEDKQDVSLD